MKSSRELTAAQIDKLIAAARERRAWFERLWRRCQEHGLPLHDPLVGEALKVGTALNDFVETCERLKRQIPKSLRPGIDPWKNHGLSAHYQPWGDLQAAANKAAADHVRNAPPDPTA